MNAESRLGKPLGRSLPILFAVVVVTLFYGSLFSPGRVPYSRDDPFLVLPQLATLHSVARYGIPWWNPLRGGGQPILSNPHYAAFYPPTWIAFFLPAHYALNLLLLFHVALAFAGAWLLTRHLGGSRVAAAIAAIGFTCGGAALSFAELFNLFCGMAWFPWIVLAGDLLFESPARRTARYAIACAGALALQTLNGDPASVVMSGLMLAALALSRAQRWRSLRRLAALGALALLLASVQLLPTWFRWRDSPRSHGLDLAQAGLWSMPPARLAEVALPRLFGAPEKDESNLFFGWRINDRSYPLLTSIYPGIFILLLAFGGLAAGGLPKRGAWTAAAAAGLFLALGRHNPLFAPIHHWVPLLAVQRYPEKFMALTMSVMVFAAALGWDRIRERCGAAAAALGSLLVLIYGGLCLLIWCDPAAITTFVRWGSSVPWSAESLGHAVSFLRHEALIGLALTSAASLILIGLRKRTANRFLVTAALLLIAVDLLHYNGHLNPTVATSWLLTPPPQAELLPKAADGRIFLAPSPDSKRAASLRVGRAGFYQLRDTLASFAPFSANLWGAAYALNKDYDLMSTGWARYARALAIEQLSHPQALRNILDAWNVSAAIYARNPRERLRDLERGLAYPPPVTVVPIPESLPRFRFPSSAVRFSDWHRALREAAAQRFNVADEEIVIDPGGRKVETAPGARLLDRSIAPARVTLDYEAAGATLLTAAMTFDPGWTARVDGASAVVLPTALGQMSVALPPGRHRLIFRYRDPWVGVGAAVTLITVLVLTLVVLTARGPRAQSVESERADERENPL